MFPYCCLLIICIMLFPCSVFKVHLSLFAQRRPRTFPRTSFSEQSILKEIRIVREADTSILHFSLFIFHLKNGGPKWTRFSAEKPRRLQRATGTLLRAAFRVHFVFLLLKYCGHRTLLTPLWNNLFWWAKVDSNHRPHDYQSCALAS